MEIFISEAHRVVGFKLISLGRGRIWVVGKRERVRGMITFKIRYMQILNVTMKPIIMYNLYTLIKCFLERIPPRTCLSWEKSYDEQDDPCVQPKGSMSAQACIPSTWVYGVKLYSQGMIHELPATQFCT
jgi:hypothetical protein